MALENKELKNMDSQLISEWFDIRDKVRGLQFITQNGKTEKIKNDAKVLLEELSIML